MLILSPRITCSPFLLKSMLEASGPNIGILETSYIRSSRPKYIKYFFEI